MQSSNGPRPPAARRAAWFIGLGSVSPPGPQGRVAGRGRATACRSSAIGTVSAGAALAEAVAVAVHLYQRNVKLLFDACLTCDASEAGLYVLQLRHQPVADCQRTA